MAECFNTTAIAGEGNVIRKAFQENTNYCDCLPLTEFDEEGNHKWKIRITKHDDNCCKAEYTCREGFRSQDDYQLPTRFCILNNDWNHTEPECRKIDMNGNGGSSAVLYISIPSALLVVLFLAMTVFVKWWRRRAKPNFNADGEDITREERNTVKVFHVKQDNGIEIGSNSYQLAMYESQLDKVQTNASADNETSLCTPNGTSESCSGHVTIDTSQPATATTYKIHIDAIADNETSLCSQPGSKGSGNELLRRQSL